MTKESTLHRWALLDKSGKTRGTCEAITKGFANTLFRRKTCKTPGQIRAKLPAGWTIVDRGPVAESTRGAADAFHKTLAETKPTPRAFQVGDRVKMLTQEGGNVPAGTVGAVTDLSASGLVEITWWSRGGTWGTYDPSRLELVEPVPQPKAEVDDFDPPITPLNKPTLRVPAYKAELDAARQEIASLQSEVTSLKAEVEKSKADLQEEYAYSARERERAEAAERDARACAHERDAAEAKLADIRAINRVAELVNAIPEDAEPWHFHGLVKTVLD